MGEKSFFISSTYRDLIEERKHAIEVINKQWHAIAMEHFPSSDQHTKNDCLEKVRLADALILIIGERYGHIDPDEQISMTEIEYNEAIRLNIPIFAFFKNYLEQKESSPLFNKFIERVKSDRVIKKFNSCSELREEIISTIYAHEKDNGEIGVRIQIVCNDEEFYLPFVNSNEGFNYLQPFVGRGFSIDELDFFLNSKTRIGIIVGDGGLGKSKLLYEWTRKIKKERKDPLILFLRENVNPTENSFRQIPSSRQVIIIIEDAHKRADYDYILNNIIYSHSNLKIIITTRKYGLAGIKEKIYTANIFKEDIKEFSELNPLIDEDLEILGKDLLSPANHGFIPFVLSHARGSPLIFSFSCWLIQNKQINIETLYANEDFENYVYQRFSDVLSQRVGNLLPDNLYQKIIQILAILSPFDTSNNKLLQLTSEYLKITPQDLRNYLNILKDNGIIEITGYNVRIKPDVFADFILYKTCFTPNGISTGYAETIFKIFFFVYPKNILRNIIEVDQWASNKKIQYNIIDNIWLQISKLVIEGNNYQRIQLLKNIAIISYYIPDKSIHLVNSCLRNPQKSIPEDNPLFTGIEYGHLEVTDVLCEVLYNISYKKEYIPTICNCLWSIADIDTREYYRSAPVSIEKLKKIAQYESQKPLEYNRIALDSIKQMVESLKEERLQILLIDILTEFLKKEGEDTNWKGFTFSYRFVYFDPQKLTAFRELSLRLVDQIVKSGSFMVQLHVIDSLIQSIRPINVKSEYKEQIRKITRKWELEDLKILNLLEKIVKSTNNWLLAFEIDQKIRWYAKGESETSQRVNEILEVISSKFNFSLIRCVQGKFDWDYEEDYEEYQKRVEEYIVECVHDLLKINPPSGFLRIVEELIQIHDEASIDINPIQFFSILGTINPEYGAEVVRLIMSQEKYALYMSIGPIINGVSGKKSELAQILCDEVIASNNYEVQLSLSHFLVWGELRNNLSDYIYNVIQYFLNSDDEKIKVNAIKSIAYLKGSNLNKGLEFVKDCQISNSIDLFKTICETISEIHRNNVIINISEILESILQKMDFVNSFGTGYIDYSINKVLVISSEIIPQSVIEMFIRRISIAEKRYKQEISDYVIFPHDGFHNELDGIFKSPEYCHYLVQIRNLTLIYKQRSYGPIPKIFCWLSNNYSESALQVLREWIQEGCEDKIIAVLDLISKAPVEFLINNHEFCSELIEKSAMISEKCFLKCMSSLQELFRYQAYSRTIGEPDPAIQKIHDESLKIASSYHKGSNTEQFYTSLSIEAMNDIKRELLDDEHMIDSYS